MKKLARRHVRTTGMRLLILLACLPFLTCFSLAQTENRQADNKIPAKQAPFPLQFELRVPFEPTAFPSGPYIHLFYELHLTNFTPKTVSLNRVEVLDANKGTSPPIATFEEAQLQAMVQRLDKRTFSDSKERLVIAGGQTAIVFMLVELNRSSPLPSRLAHRVSTADSEMEGAVISSRHTELHVLGPPLQGADWLAADGPSNDEDNHHRRGVLIFDGAPVDSRRYAIDWKQVRDGASFSGDSRDVRSYYSYEKPVLAVADGHILTARDGLPDNIPGHFDAFHPAVPITFETQAGNTITLDLGGGQFAYYAHLQPGSLRVKAGDRVRRGQVLGRIGCSGDAREPHLHFEVTTSAKAVAGEGVPYVIDRYTLKAENGGPAAVRVNELPLRNSIVEFSEHAK
jgi:peptidase M23-like protein